MHAAETVTLPEAKDEDLNRLLDQSSRSPVLIYFTVSWCGPCKVFGPLMDQYASGHPELAAYRVDCEASPKLAAHFDVGLFPTLAVIRHRSIHWSKSGALDETELNKTVGAVIEAASQVGAEESGNDTNLESFPEDYQLPQGIDARIRVEVARRTVEGETTEIEQLKAGSMFCLSDSDGLRVIIESDEREHPPLELSALAEFPRAPYEFVVVNSRTIPVEEMMHLAGLRDIDTLLISALEPLDAGAIEGLTAVHARSVHAQIPGFDADYLRRRVPGTTVNYTAMSAALIAHLPSVVVPRESAHWSAVEELNQRVAAGDHVVAMVQLEHPADIEVGSAWHAAVRSGALPEALSVSAYASDLALQLALEPRNPAIAVWKAGELIQRLDLPFEESDVACFTPKVAGTQPPPKTGILHRSERIISLPGSAIEQVRVELVAPGTSSAGAVFELKQGQTELVPEGWHIRVRASLSAEDDGQWEGWAHLGVQSLHLDGMVTDQVLERVTVLDSLEHLEVMSAVPPSADAVAKAVRSLPALRSLRIYGLENPETIGAARESLIVNGNWPLLPGQGTEY